MIFSRSTLIGAVVGLCLAAAVMLLAWFNQDGSEALQAIINFFASLPALLLVVAPFDVPESLQIILFFIYWALVGGIIGWLAGKDHAIHRIAIVVVIVVLILSHWAAKAKLERDIEAAIRAFVGALFGGSTP